MRTVKVSYTGSSWFTSINLWIEDEAHRDTVRFWVTLTKPTPRQLRRFKKYAKSVFRKGTRAQQRAYLATLKS